MAHKIELYGIVGWDFGPNTIARQLRAAMGENVDVHVHSGGGYVDDGVAIYNQLRQYSGNVRIVVDGLAASAASLIAMAGDEVVMPAGSMMMIHNPWSVSVGQASDHRDNAEVLERWAESLVDAYAAKTNVDRSELVEMLNAETWLTGTEAMNLGFANSTEFDGDDMSEEDEDENLVVELNAAIEQYRAAAARDERMPLYRGPVRNEPKTYELRDAYIEVGGVKVENITPNFHLDEHEVARAAAEISRNIRTITSTGRVAAHVFEKPSEIEEMNPNENKTANAKPELDANQIKALETKRIQAIRALAKKHEVDDDQVDAWIESDSTIDEVRAMALDIIAAKRNVVEPATQIQVVKDRQENFAAALEDNLETRLGRKARDFQSPYASYSLMDFVRERVQATHGSAGLVGSKEDIVKRAFASGITHGNDDFPIVLQNTAHKSMLIGWQSAGETWQRWCRQGSLADFKQHNRVGLGFFQELLEVPEMGEYTSSTISERGSTIQAVKYGRLIGLSWEMIINDDLDAFGRIPMLQGAAANRTIGNKVYKLLTDNNAMYDGNNLFDNATHGNDLTGTALDEAGLGAMRSAMRLQATGDGSAEDQQILNLTPRYLLVPAALETDARRQMNAAVIPGGSGESLDNINNGLYELIVEGRLDANSAVRYYGIASSMMIDTVEVSGLGGAPAPELFQEQGFTTDGIQYKARVVAGIAAHDWRGLIRVTGT